jgi:pimeloyl-ACP methyl ester carboxylesterase
MGFPTGARYKGTSEQKETLERVYLRKAQFMTENKTPVWNGEFGPVYADKTFDVEAETINQERYNLLGDQLRIYDKYNISWSIWLYKDIGLQGMIYTDPESKWNKTIKPFLDKKRAFWLDKWGRRPAPEPEAALRPLLDWVDRVSPTAKETYPTSWNTELHVMRGVFYTFLAASFVDEFAELFRGSSEKDLEELARSFHFDNCVQRDGLNRILKDHARSSH